MLTGIGVDIIEIQRVADALRRTPGLREELFSEAEIAYCESKRFTSQHYAARFAAKEALYKALATGKTAATRWSWIEILPDPSGNPLIGLRADFIAHYPFLKEARIHVSLSHNRSSAAAFVVIEECDR